MHDVAGREERLYTTTNTYSSTPSDLGYGAVGSTFPLVVGSGYYQINVVAAAGPPSTFSVVATPVAGQGQDLDTQCASFTVDQAGRQSSLNSASGNSTTTCW